MVRSVKFSLVLVLLTKYALSLENNTLFEGLDSTSDANILETLLRGSNGLLTSLTGGKGAGNRSASAFTLLKLRSNEGAINADCADHVGILLQALDAKEKWAMRMLDAIGKPPSGLLQMKLTWLGDWEECVQIKATLPSNQSEAAALGNMSSQANPFLGQYCSVAIPLQTPQFTGSRISVSIGVCVPDSCNADDTKQLIDLGFSFLPGNITVPEPRVSCRERHISLDTRAIVAIIICAVFLALMTVATIYDALYLNWLMKLRQVSKSIGKMENGVYTKTDIPTSSDTVKGVNSDKTCSVETLSNTPGQAVASADPGPKKPASTAVKLLLSFSVFTNGSKLLNTSQGRDSLTAVHGIRFISMTWVILGHGFSALKMPVIENGMTYGRDLMSRREFAAVLNAYLSVDTFFVLSGLLVSYLSLKEMKRIGSAKRFKWGMFYFHRFWRLTPPYMMALMLYVCLLRYVADGPVWRQEGHADADCSKGWWKNLLYVNNLVKGEQQQLGCMQWTWYLANDMQFYIVSPLMLVPLFYSPVLGGLSCLLFLGVGMISSGVISRENDLPPEQLYDSTKAKTFSWDYYVKPWCRIGPYVIGVFAGYLLYRYKRDVNIPKIANLLGWMVSVGLGCLIVYGLFSADLTNPMSLNVSALFNATARTTWGACVAWVIFACATGHGGPVNGFLSWPGFVPLSRLTYFAYLCHPITMEVYIFSQRTTLQVYDYAMVYQMIGHVVTAYATATVLSLAFEAPMMGLEKVLISRNKRS